MASVCRTWVEVKRDRRRAGSIVGLWRRISFAIDAVIHLAHLLYRRVDNDWWMVQSNTSIALALSTTTCSSYHSRSPPSVSIHSQSDGIGVNSCALPSCTPSILDSVEPNTVSKCTALRSSCFCHWCWSLALRSQAACSGSLVTKNSPLR